MPGGWEALPEIHKIRTAAMNSGSHFYIQGPRFFGRDWFVSCSRSVNIPAGRCGHRPLRWGTHAAFRWGRTLFLVGADAFIGPRPYGRDLSIFWTTLSTNPAGRCGHRPLRWGTHAAFRWGRTLFLVGADAFIGPRPYGRDLSIFWTTLSTNPAGRCVHRPMAEIYKRRKAAGPWACG